jgi:DNA-binding IclR family transcriptional regulator
VEGDGPSRDGDSDAAAGGYRPPAVSRAASILRVLASDGSGLGVNEIARRVGIVPSTCFYALRGLVEEGFVAFNPETKAYNCGLGLFTLVREAMANSSFPKTVQPVLDKLSQDTGVTAMAVEFNQHDRVVVMALARSSSLVSLPVNVGSRFPSLIGAPGRCFAAASGLPRETLEEKFKALRLDQPPSFEDWFRDVERTRQNNIGVDRSNYMRGLTGVATLLPMSSHENVRGIVLVGLEHQLPKPRLRTVYKKLSGAAQYAASQLGQPNALTSRVAISPPQRLYPQ